MSVAENIRDAGRLVHFWSRKDFRELPLEFVLVPSLDAPVLVHERQAPVFVDADGYTRPALPMLIEQRQLYPRVLLDPVKRGPFAKLLRRIWLQVVDQADYYTWPDANHYGAQAYYEFAPDEVR